MPGRGRDRAWPGRPSRLAHLADARRHGRPGPPDHTLRLVARLIAADEDAELLIVPGAEHRSIDCLPYVRKRARDFLVREPMGTQPPAYRPTSIPITPESLGELFA
ncbi:hypothetical protein [Streptosporangium roseum]|uniref:hypothetical protein n=1 Tax=Streptosporangium roseum TaxID=2001 RepID=UPI0004CD07C2|nr:hypothetical protein [Streptosporangium roseum]